MLNPEALGRILAVLNKARSMELHAIHQYMSQHYALDNMDYGELADKVKDIAIVEMKHAELFAERIRELEGLPGHELAALVEKEQSIKDIYTYDMELEDNTLIVYNEFLSVCQSNHDYLSSKLFREILEEEQEHFDYFNNTNNHLHNLGDSFLARMAGSSKD